MFIKPTVIPIREYTIKESFDQTNLITNVYTILATLYNENMGFGIMNNSETDVLTVTIGSVIITVPITKSFYGIFTKDTTIEITGTNSDFDAFIEG